MPILKMIPMIFMAAALAACGGGGSGDVVGSGSEGPTEDGTTNPETPPTIRIGSGEGTSFKNGVLVADVTNLSASGQTLIRANIVNADKGNAKVTTQSFKVKFSSGCASATPALAKFSAEEMTTSSGEVAVTYTAKGCSGNDDVVFQLVKESDADDSAQQQAVVTLTIEPPEVGNISFAGSSTPQMGIQTIANTQLPTVSEVSFRVADKYNNPIANKDVTFYLISATGNTGGVTFPEGADKVKTDQNGLAVAVLNSGTAHTSVAVKAETTGTNGKKITTSSQYISVTTGLARQDKFSIAASVFNPGAYNIDNVSVTITASGADQYGNLVPDGTVINFTSESGRISPSCITSGGSCTATWNSSGSRPGADPAHEAELGLQNEQIGMTTIMAYTVGEAGYTDKNGNGIFDADEQFVKYGEAFRDDNADKTYASWKFFVDSDFDGQWTDKPSTYQGALCSDSARGIGHCGSLMHVRQQLRIVQSVANSVVMRFYEQTGANTYNELSGIPTLASSGGAPSAGSFVVVLQDVNGNMPASGTNLSITTQGYKTFGLKGDVDNGIGIIDATLYSGLPNFGAVFPVSYIPEAGATAESITIKAVSGSAELEALLTP